MDIIRYILHHFTYAAAPSENHPDTNTGNAFISVSQKRLL